MGEVDGSDALLRRRVSHKTQQPSPYSSSSDGGDHHLIPPASWTFNKDGLPQAIAHRGYKAEFPENTMGAFRGAVEVGAHAIETDVHLSKDDVVVISHVCISLGGGVDWTHRPSPHFPSLPSTSILFPLPLSAPLPRTELTRTDALPPPPRTKTSSAAMARTASSATTTGPTSRRSGRSPSPGSPCPGSPTSSPTSPSRAASTSGCSSTSRSTTRPAS